ncbi:MAG: hypothetical protein ACI805_002844, partial [Candidatus Azotimanducaceae bacterium]
MNFQTAIEQLSQDDLGGIALPIFVVAIVVESLISKS